MEQEPTNLQIAMDDATAARITAWVLGEASAFEAEQLEELCRTQAEWRSYEQSRRVLHGFIAEAEKSPDDDESWKISPEKRDALLEEISRPTKSQKKRWKVPRQSLLRAACITVFFGLSGLYISQSFINPSHLAMAPMAEKSVQGIVQAERGFVVDGRMRELEGEVQQQEDIVTEARKQRDLFLRRAPRVIADKSTDTAASTDSFTYASPQKLALAGGQSTDSRLDAPEDGVASASENAPLAASASKPSAPSASNAKVIASSEPSSIEIPVPSVNTVQPPDDFGDGDNYGNGFGSLAGKEKKLEVTSAALTDRVSKRAEIYGRENEIQEFAKKGSARYSQDEGLKADLKPGSRQAGYMNASPEEEKNESSTASREMPRRGVSAPVLSGKNENQKVLEFDDRDLARADGLLALGKFKESKNAYEDVLRKDPTNADARRGLERAQSAKEEYYKSAYDHSRAELLTEVDKVWELSARTPLIQEKPTSEDPYSTFSLRVSDASFQLAYRALQKGNRPQPHEIRSEDFYNAFDYGDAAASGEPVVCAIEQSAHPFAPQRNLLRLSMAVGASGRSAAQPLHLTLVVDQSGSMERDDRNEIMKASVVELGKLLTEKDRVSVIGFSRTPRLLGENIVGNDLAKWQSLVTTAPNDGGTNLEQALQLGETIATRHKNAVAQNRVLLVTDGAANLGNANPENLAVRVKEMRQRGLCFDVVGVGTGGENDLRLLELSRHGNGRYQVLQNVGDAKETFASQLAGAFRPAAENVKVQVHFNDKRVKSFLLHGFEKDRLHTEDFRNDKVDAAEIAANEVGNALYQFQTIPDGEGDVGEASVRFRDPATGMMIERKWTIPWQPAAPAFDQASPSLQLAGLSLQAAQFLQGSPLAAPSMSPYFSTVEENVRCQFGNQVNVAKLLEMLRQIK